MAKLTTADIVRILAEFGKAESTARYSQVSMIAAAMPHEALTVTRFRYKKSDMVIVSDNTIDDDEATLLEKAHLETDIEMCIVTPPSTPDQLHILYKGRATYLLQSDRSQKQRLDAFLAETQHEASRSTWQKQIKAGAVTVNGVTETSAKYLVDSNDEIKASLPERRDTSEETLPILYIDDDIIVIDKPIGVLTHSKGALNDEFTVADMFRRYTTWGLDTNRPGVVHRLDRDTSGIIVGARHEAAGAFLQKQFSERRVKKLYTAVVSTHLTPQEAIIDIPIGRNPTAPSTFRPDPNGKTATTRYKVIEYFNKGSLVELMPTSGRTHQLRVHMQYLNAPIIGDVVYGKPADRLYLHATKLEITRPDRVRVEYTSDVPKEFYDTAL